MPLKKNIKKIVSFKKHESTKHKFKEKKIVQGWNNSSTLTPKFIKWYPTFLVKEKEYIFLILKNLKIINPLLYDEKGGLF